jgi:peroxiredoxin
MTDISQYFATKPAYYNRRKGNEIPKQTWTGPEGSRNFKIMMVLIFSAPAAFTPQKIFLVFISVRDRVYPMP